MSEDADETHRAFPKIALPGEFPRPTMPADLTPLGFFWLICMRKRRIRIVAGGLATLGLLAALVCYLGFRTPPMERRMMLVAERARSRVDPHRLQSWAVSVLSQKPLPSTSQVEHMEIPQELHRLYESEWQYGPFVIFSEKDENNSDDYLEIHWGGGFGHWGFLVGPPSFRTQDPFYAVIEWIPGVYFFRYTH
jgi:hypothetical protein